ncbi:MAG: hypothetical protein ISP66_02570 [Flavobacteriaceae bacterium]|nr:hypothetical protein [Flavobacteriaceae bacterium]MDA8758488.1 hypothetical protein [Flavobacteriaceae bacterium]RPG64738.1 MAG: hypothetical protein CBC02_008755 [Flavobacteriaceae bacterium TMED42]RPG67792.1 MAG: hypothetical protein CBC02_001250 [Flavobacteriaceae bacterium TMED42]|tara:strand:+ start:2467 stop:3072 length:606 start_codon:yes stop_codon:yes gene_type:complete
MKKGLALLIILFFSFASAQERDALLEGLFEEEVNMEEQLLPQKMIFTQSLLWGKKGLFRKTGISKLSLEQREKELKVRNVMLKSHQIIGYLTLAGMVAQGIMGGKLYNGDYELYDAHKTLGEWVTVSYFTGAGLSLFAPPPLVRKKVKGFNSIKAHKWLAYVHFSGMIATNAWSKEDRDWHKYAAYTTFASYATAVLVFKF